MTAQESQTWQAETAMESTSADDSPDPKCTREAEDAGCHACNNQSQQQSSNKQPHCWRYRRWPMLTLWLTVCANVWSVSAQISPYPEEHMSGRRPTNTTLITNILDQLVHEKNYDKRLRPNYGGYYITMLTWVIGYRCWVLSVRTSSW